MPIQIACGISATQLAASDAVTNQANPCAWLTITANGARTAAVASAGAQHCQLNRGALPTTLACGTQQEMAARNDANCCMQHAALAKLITVACGTSQEAQPEFAARLAT
jgi:hypothetical protein